MAFGVKVLARKRRILSEGRTGLVISSIMKNIEYCRPTDGSQKIVRIEDMHFCWEFGSLPFLDHHK